MAEILIPLKLAPTMLVSSSVPEPDASMGEVAWVSGGMYTLGQRRTSAGSIYECVQAHTGRAILPAQDTGWWLRYRPTNRMAMFDALISTQTVSTSTLTVVLAPGFFNATGFYLLQGETLTLTVRNGPGGPVIYTTTVSLIEDVVDYYEWFFSPIRYKSKLVLADIEPYDNAEVTLTITPADGRAAVGMQTIGDLTPLAEVLGTGTKFGASAEPVTYSYIKVESDGERVIEPGNSATNLRLTVALHRDDADAALQRLQEVLDVPCAIIGSRLPGYDGLNVFGLASSRVTYLNAVQAQIETTVEGVV